MKNISNKLKINLEVIISIMGWFAVLFQLYLIILNRVVAVAETVARFFSFFTIQTNILVAVCFTFLWLKPNSKYGIFFSNPKCISAVTLYILIVGIVYNVILRFLWVPTGLQKVVDELLHTVIPILVLTYWLLFVDKKLLRFKNIFTWLIFPFLYLVYTLIRGYFVEFYPYPFLDVIQLGYNQVLINSFFMLVAFLVIGGLLVSSSKAFNKTLQ